LLGLITLQSPAPSRPTGDHPCRDASRPDHCGRPFSASRASTRAPCADASSYRDVVVLRVEETATGATSTVRTRSVGNCGALRGTAAEVPRLRRCPPLGEGDDGLEPWPGGPTGQFASYRCIAARVREEVSHTLAAASLPPDVHAGRRASARMSPVRSVTKRRLWALAVVSRWNPRPRPPGRPLNA
jgi:hypothetical protein